MLVVVVIVVVVFVGGEMKQTNPNPTETDWPAESMHPMDAQITHLLSPLPWNGAKIKWNEKQTNVNSS